MKLRANKTLDSRSNRMLLSKRFRPRCEMLEDRQLLSASFPHVTAGLENAILKINGTFLSDTIQVRQMNNHISVDGVYGSFSVSLVQKIEISGGAGNDQIYLNSEQVVGQQAITIPCLVRAGIGNDSITGSTAGDFLFGEGGEDKIWAMDGSDYVDGGAGNDSLFGQDGADKIYGDQGNDSIYGGAFSDFLVGGDDSDWLFGGTEADFLDGSRGADHIYGEAGYDYVYDDATGNIISDSSMNRSVGHCGWFDMKIDDAALRSQSRILARDLTLDRADMLQVFQQVEADGTVSSTEFSDLKDLVVGGSFAPGMPEYVRNLTKKVVNGDPANAHYLCNTLGNLHANDPGSRLEKLVNKWFLGLDRPVTSSGTYHAVSGLLFQNGINFHDIVQGGVGDCYLMAVLAESALRTPNTIQTMFIENGDHTVTVRFYKNGVADYVTVDRMLPVNSSGSAVYATFGGNYNSGTNELWVALAEKAYAQLNESGWTGQDGTNSYAGIDVGSPADAMKQITARSATGYASLNKNSVIAAFNAGKLVAFSSKKDQADIPSTVNVAAHHVYALVDYSPTTQKFTLYNPWGLELKLTWTEITQGFRAWHYTHS